MQNQLPNAAPGGWLARVLGAAISVIVMVGLFVLGLTVFAAVAGLALLVFVVLALRVWWLRRRLRRDAERAAGPQDRRDRARGPGVTLEGEFEERDDPSRR